MPRLLLINPRFKPTFWTMHWMFGKIRRKESCLLGPPGLASVASLSPEGCDIPILDENVEEIDWDDPADVVGVSGMTSQYDRQREILEWNASGRWGSPRATACSASWFYFGTEVSMNLASE